MSIIAFQGELGANSHIACLEAYPHMQPLPCVTFSQALQSVENGTAEKALIPIENSLAGRVADIHQILPYSKLFIIGEYFLPIHFALMAKNHTDFNKIKTIHSHVHALAQCRNLIEKNNWQPIIAYDTAGAAKWLSKEEDESIAVLAPKLAAEIYGLTILAENVEDAKHNITRFVVFSRERHSPPFIAGQKFITTLLFEVRNVPAALYKALGVFASNGINLTKLESYQLEDSFRATQFLVDIEAHIEEENMQLALEELKFFSKTVHILGVYPAAAPRK